MAKLEGTTPRQVIAAQHAAPAIVPAQEPRQESGAEMAAPMNYGAASE
jgi:hypothetical protein